VEPQRSAVPFEPAFTILIVEDEHLLRFALSDFLTATGFDVLEANDVADALAILNCPDASVDLVFSDIRMPGIRDGLDLARWMHTNRAETPVFLTSGDTRLIQAATKLSTDEMFFSKPYNRAFLAARMRDAVTTAHARSAAITRH
jgi:DNA-binding response OmpR family regulator